MSNQRELWYSLSNEKYNKDCVQTAAQGYYSIFFLEAKLLSWIEKVKLPRKMSFAFLIESIEDFAKIEGHGSALSKTKYLIFKDIQLYEKISVDEKIKKGLLIDVVDKSTLLNTVELSKIVDLLVIEFKDPTNIPLELVLAKTQSTKTTVIKKVKTAQDGAGSLMTMEMGSDGILLESNNIEEIMALDNEFQKSTYVDFNLLPAKVKRLQHVGMGNRVCIDTASELTEDEGMLLGSTSQGGLFVCSETHFLPYMNLRPFRVNAGALHMYVWGPNNFCAYLSDLKAGDEVYAINSKGKARSVTVGRIKIERRPLLLIEAEIGDKIVNSFIQDDWHVRVMGSKGEIRPSAEIEVGDLLLGYLDEPGRHVGYKINETIKEV